MRTALASSATAALEHAYAGPCHGSKRVPQDRSRGWTLDRAARPCALARAGGQWNDPDLDLCRDVIPFCAAPLLGAADVRQVDSAEAWRCSVGLGGVDVLLSG